MIKLFKYLIFLNLSYSKIYILKKKNKIAGVIVSEVTKLARVIVDEINDVNKIYSVFDMAYRFDPGVYGAFGVGCGDNCDAWGIGCGNNCLQGLPLRDELIKIRLGIDVLGKKGLTGEHMLLLRKDPMKVNEAVIKELSNKLNPDNIKKRIRM
jgi:hypothetical protein